MDLKIFLKNLPAFEEFQSNHLETFASHLQVGEYEDGHAFITQGHQGDALYLLLSGAVRLLCRDADGTEHEVRDLSDGELFGTLSLVDDMPASASCIAKGKVKAAFLTRDAFRLLFKEASPIGHHLQYMVAVQMARDIQEQNRRYREALARS